MKGLLFLQDGSEFDPFGEETLFDHPDWVRIFNAYKNDSVDRQIGDRRGRNFKEDRVLGPSRFLPAGPDSIDIYADPRHEYLAVAVTDRKDFYHQRQSSRRKTLTNSVVAFP